MLSRLMSDVADAWPFSVFRASKHSDNGKWIMLEEHRNSKKRNSKKVICKDSKFTLKQMVYNGERQTFFFVYTPLKWVIGELLFPYCLFYDQNVRLFVSHMNHCFTRAYHTTHTLPTRPALLGVPTALPSNEKNVWKVHLKSEICEIYLV